MTLELHTWAMFGGTNVLTRDIVQHLAFNRFSSTLPRLRLLQDCEDQLQPTPTTNKLPILDEILHQPRRGGSADRLPWLVMSRIESVMLQRVFPMCRGGIRDFGQVISVLP